MLIEQMQWQPDSGWSQQSTSLGEKAQWVLIFGDPTPLQNNELIQTLRTQYPNALMTGCSTAGEILGDRVQDQTLVVTAVHFEHASLRTATVHIESSSDSQQAGQYLAEQLSATDLVHVMIFADGLHFQGAALAEGLRQYLPTNVSVTGGLAGDGERMKKTLVCADAEVASRCAVAVGFYGARLRVGYGSLGGWDTFGPQRLITRSEGNVLYELDGQPALALYKRYLGEDAAQLPASGIRFPLTLTGPDIDENGIVRTVFAVDESSGSMTFGGDMPQGAHARLMKANFDRLIEGAANAARSGLQGLNSFTPELAVLISCVGRKMVLKQRIEEEVDGVRSVLGPQTVQTGFYSYGEIGPQGAFRKCELHNQTMTVTTFAES